MTKYRHKNSHTLYNFNRNIKNEWVSEWMNVAQMLPLTDAKAMTTVSISTYKKSKKKKKINTIQWDSNIKRKNT